MTSSRKLLLSLLLLGLAVDATAQLHLPLIKKDKDKTYDPEAAMATLRSGTDQQRNDLATELRIMAPNASNPSAKSDAPCTTFNQVEEKKLRLRPEADNAVLLAYSSDCDSTYLIAFERGNKSEWRHLQTVRLASRVQKPEISYAELIQPGVSEIVVHRETTRDTGAAEQENFVLLKLLHDRLVPVLDTVERLDVILPVRASDDHDQAEQSQKSTFKAIKAEPNSGAIIRILQKEELKERKASIAVYRSWSWDPGLECFRSTASGDSDVAQWQSAKEKPAKSAASAVPPKPQANLPSQK